MDRKHYVFALLLLLLIFLGWHLIRPLNIFVVTDNFERPVDTALLPATINSLHARDCGKCHKDFLQEWQTSMHSQAWVDPYYQADWRFDDNANRVCVRCNVVERERWDTFFRFPPCGTVAEIQAASSIYNQAEKYSDNKTGEMSLQDISELGCVECHMPAVQRPLVEGGVARMARRHLWRGGHDPEMVRKASQANSDSDVAAFYH
jgi:hypothetical protein